MKTFGILIAFLFGVVVCTASCSTGSTNSNLPPPLKASEYNQSCTFATDCAPVADGQTCGCQGCGGTGAVNVSDRQRFDADYAARRAMCPPSHELCPDVDCRHPSVYCNAGTCAVCAFGDTKCAAPAPLDASKYNQTCKASSDCRPVQEVICGTCGCGATAAINAGDMERFDADTSAQRAQCPPTQCPGAACQPVYAYCNAGKCAVCNDPSCRGLNPGDACDPANDRCTSGTLCCARTSDGGATANVCTQADTADAGPACP
jgi:hypothetical protein